MIKKPARPPAGVWTGAPPPHSNCVPGCVFVQRRQTVSGCHVEEQREEAIEISEASHQPATTVEVPDTRNYGIAKLTRR